MKPRSNPTEIDLAQLSAKPLVLEGSVAPGDLPRLAESLANGEGELRYKVSARQDPQQGAVVSCIIEGFVFLTCQSSLDTFSHPVSIDDRLVLVDDESRLPPMEEQSDTEDYLVVDEPLDVLELVEDAVILALPMMPRKPGLEWNDDEAQEPPVDRPSPFAKLSSLKKSQ
jgi:uncharacterized protein